MTKLSLSERQKIMREAMLAETTEDALSRESAAYYLVFHYRECNFYLILN